MNLPRAMLFSAVLSAVTSTVAGSALAQSTAFVAVENIKYELIDLDPNDGILPTITFSAYEGRYGAYSWSAASDYAGIDYPNDRSTTVLVPVSSNASYVDLPTDLAAQSSLTGSLPAGMTISGSVSVNGGSGYSYYASTQAGTGIAEFMLSPNAAVRFSMDMTVGAAYGANPPLYQEIHGGGYTRVVTVQGFLEPGEHIFGGTEINWGLYEDGSGSRSTSFSGLVENRSAVASNNLFYIEANANVMSIPEPETYAMVLAGLVVVQLVRRRRARQAG